VVGSVALSVVVATFGALAGCQVDRVPFNRLDTGKEFLEADESFQAAEYFEESLELEPETSASAHAHLAIAYDRSMKKVQGIPSEYQKHSAARAQHLATVSKDPTAIPYLVHALEYHNLSSQSAEELLVELGGTAVPALLYGYQRKSEERDTIRRLLRTIGSPAVSGIRKSVGSPDLVVQNRAQLVRLLGEMDNPEARTFLAELQADPAMDEAIRVEAAAALYLLGDKQHRDFLVASLSTQDVLARRAAAYCMSFLNDEPNPEMLLSHLDDPDSEVCMHIAAALGEHRSDPNAVDALVELLRTTDENLVGNAAVAALGKYGEDVIDPILEALKFDAKSEHWTRRQRLVRALADENVLGGFDEDREFKLYEHWQDREQRDEVKGDIARLLESLESK
jgi:HEAT repeat protein